MAASLRERGNDAFRMGSLATALDYYAQATEQDQSDAASPNNAAACHLKLKQFAQAKACCDESIARDPSNAKSYVRRAQANHGLNLDGRAVRDYRTALKLDSRHATASKELDELVRARRREAKQAATDPRIAPWVTLFRNNLKAQQSTGKVSRKDQHAEEDEADRLDSEPETRRLRRAFMRHFEREVGLRTTSDDDEGSESESSGGDESDDEGEDGDEWETDSEDDAMEQDQPANGVHIDR